ncbi:MAG TPA: histidine phosphatase family protein, partial [Burkholderiaceae bacterium]|nr:histidine phosphatase family protein [Burkholderiaceae bacterium]
MRLLLIRHAIAEASEAFAASGRPDEERPLTDRGRRRMRANALGLSLLVPSLDLLVSSPYRRAADTAAIVAAALELPRDDAQLQHESLAHDRAPIWARHQQVERRHEQRQP